MDRDAAEIEAFLQRLEEALEARGISKSALARILGVRQSTVSEWWTKRRVPMGDVILRLPAIVGRSGSWLLTGDEEPEGQGELSEGAHTISRAPYTTHSEAEELFLSLPYVTRFIGGIAPQGQAKELKLDSLEGYRRMIAGRAPVPPWWYDLKRKIEDGEL